MTVEKPYLCSPFRGSTFAIDWLFKVPTAMIGWLSVVEGLLDGVKRKHQEIIHCTLKAQCKFTIIVLKFFNFQTEKKK